MRIVRTSAAVLAFAVLSPLQAVAWFPQDPPASSAGANLRIHAQTAAPEPASVRSSADALRQLRGAISSNDLARFRSLLPAARTFADGMPIGSERNILRRILLVSADLETVWSYASSQSSGSFYDDESLAGVHDHLSADYAGYAGFIDQYRVIDRSGRILYPTAETRSFLLQRLNELSFPPAVPARPRSTAPASATAGRQKVRGAAAPRPGTARPASHAVAVRGKKHVSTLTPRVQPKKGKTKPIARPLPRPATKPLPPKP